MKCIFKTCTKCKEPKQIINFSKRKASKDGLTARCSQCLNTKQLMIRQSNPEINRNNNLKARFGMTIDQYNIMFLKHKGKCAICHKAEVATGKNGKAKWLSVDHNHDTNQIRGLLCNGCNTGIGLLGDSVKVLGSAIKYLNERGSYGEK